MSEVMPQVNDAVATLERRLRRAQIQRILLLWFTVMLFFLVGILFIRFHSNQIDGCQRGKTRSEILADIAQRAGAHEAARKAAAQARIDCSAAYSWF